MSEATMGSHATHGPRALALMHNGFGDKDGQRRLCVDIPVMRSWIYGCFNPAFDHSPGLESTK